ncbi:Cupredoxin, partial [Endogone sp. FLAS-F59071]
MTVIEADGVNMQPVQVNRIPIHVAQRYSVIVNASQAVGNYWIRAVLNTNCFNVNNPALNPTVLGVIQYEGAPAGNPSSTDWSTAYGLDCLDLTLDMLQPYIPQSVPDADVQYVLDISFQTIAASHINLGYINSTSWSPLMSNPTLFSANQGVSTFDPSQFIITLNSTQVVELVLNNLDEGAHPFHFHGHVFWVLGWGAGSYEPGKTQLNTTNPLRRDTSTIPAFGYTVVRFVNDNPGLWALHCHIEWHVEAGLLVQFNSLPNQIKVS